MNSEKEQEDGATEAYKWGEITDIATVALLKQRASVSFEATLQVINELQSACLDIVNMPIGGAHRVRFDQCGRTRDQRSCIRQCRNRPPRKPPR